MAGAVMGDLAGEIEDVDHRRHDVELCRRDSRPVVCEANVVCGDGEAKLLERQEAGCWQREDRRARRSGRRTADAQIAMLTDDDQARIDACAGSLKEGDEVPNGLGNNRRVAVCRDPVIKAADLFCTPRALARAGGLSLRPGGSACGECLPAARGWIASTASASRTCR
jgi:hypothetical protein